MDVMFRYRVRKVNQVVEYPGTFVVQEPFGIEMLHATAFTTEPPHLATRHVRIAGHDYEVLADGLKAVVRTRGLAKKQKQELAEDVVTVTTTPPILIPVAEQVAR
jgi:hypothetical protein